MFYRTISLIKYLCMCLLNKYYRNCGGHHDSDRIAVLVMVSKAESIVLYLSSCIYTKICLKSVCRRSHNAVRNYGSIVAGDVSN